MSRRRTNRAPWAPVRMTSALLVLGGCTTAVSPPPPAPSLVAPPRVEDENGGDAVGIVGRRSFVRIDDVAADVWLVRRHDRAPTLVGLPALDVLHTTIRHSSDAVRLLVTLASGRPVDGVLDLGLETTDGRWFADFPLAGGAPTRLVAPTGEPVRCPGSGALRRLSDLSVSVPRTCLGSPEWVTVVVLLSAPFDGGTAYENPHNSRPFAEDGTGRLYPPG